MIIKALNTFNGVLDLGALERLQESNPCEKYPFRAYVRPGDVIEVDDKFYTLLSIQNALRLGYIQIGSVSNLNTSLIDGSYTGTTVELIAGESLAVGNVVYYKNDGKVYKAKSDSNSTMICVGMSTEVCNANDKVTLLVHGLIRNSSVFTFTIGGQASQINQAIVYVSDITIGNVTQVRPTLSGHIVQIIGYALTTDILSFTPDYTYIELV